MSSWRILGLAAALLLSGCASLWRVNSEVQSFAHWTAPPGPVRFRFERLPSQQTEAQLALEQQALPALAQAGLLLDGPAAPFSLQLTSVVQETSSRDDPYLWGSYGYSPWIGGRGMQLGLTVPLWRPPLRSYQRQLSLVLRELASGQVVYETRASVDSRSPIGSQAVPALVGAALQGFPQPPSGPRMVSIELPH